MTSPAQLQPAREFLKAELVLEAIRRCGRAEIRVTGISMLPALQPGDLVTISGECLECIRPGNVVLFRRDEEFFLHRVVERHAGILITRGDANRDCDPPVSVTELIGRAVCVRRRGATIAFDRQPLRAWLLSRSALMRGLYARLTACGEHLQSIVAG